MLPLHHPVLLAKQLASVDQVSKGRVIVGVGAGYVGAQFAAGGVGLSDRGGRMNEYLDAMRALWTMPNPEFHGRHVEFSGVVRTGTGSALEYVAGEGLDCGGRLFRVEFLDGGDGVWRGDKEPWRRLDEAMVEGLAIGDGGCPCRGHRGIG